jgi:hypothetical protein
MDIEEIDKQTAATQCLMVVGVVVTPLGALDQGTKHLMVVGPAVGRVIALLVSDSLHSSRVLREVFSLLIFLELKNSQCWLFLF